MKIVKLKIQSKIFFSEEEKENKNIITKDWLDFGVSENALLLNYQLNLIPNWVILTFTPLFFC